VADRGWASTKAARLDPNNAVMTAAVAAMTRRRLLVNGTLAAGVTGVIGCAS
jgi:hypothetical protein